MFGQQAAWVRHNGLMSENFTIHPADVKDGAVRPFGPVDPETKRQLSIPGTFVRIVRYADLPLSVELSCVFDGEKIQVKKLCAVGDAESYVTSRDLTQLSLPSVIRQIGLQVITDAAYWTMEWQDAHSVKEGLKSDPHFLAQLYWFEHATWGSPRVAVQEYLGCKRTTANYYIRMAGTVTPLPGLHKKQK
jgi:hypothetical protein